MCVVYFFKIIFSFFFFFFFLFSFSKSRLLHGAYWIGRGMTEVSWVLAKEFGLKT